MPHKLKKIIGEQIDVNVNVSNIKLNTGNPINLGGVLIGGKGTFSCELSDPDGNLTSAALSSFFIDDDDIKDIKLQFLIKDFERFKITFVTNETLPPSITMENISMSLAARLPSLIIARCAAEYILKILHNTKSVEIKPMDSVLKRTSHCEIESVMKNKPLDMKLMLDYELWRLDSVSYYTNGDLCVGMTYGNPFSNELNNYGVYISLRQGILKQVDEIKEILETTLKIPQSIFLQVADITRYVDIAEDESEVRDNAEDESKVPDNAEDPAIFDKFGLFGTGLRRRKNTMTDYQSNEFKIGIIGNTRNNPKTGF